MDIKTKVRWETLGALLVYGSVTCGTGAKLGYSCGYEAAEKDTARERICQEYLKDDKEELLARFTEQCQDRNAYNLNNGDLQRIVAERDYLLGKNQCQVDEEWYCIPNIPSDLDKGFHVKVKHK